jgi:arylsulfatase A-like enzyme
MPTSPPARWLPLLAATGLLVGAGTAAIAAERPNLIVFYTDDHGYADLGIQGIVDDVQTPHTDALARGGALVRHGYSTAPQCVPSRAGLLTGRFQARFGVEANPSSLDGFDRQTTLAQRLQSAGYATAQFGKWHLGPTREIPRHGFDHVFSQNAQRPFDANIDLDGSDRPMGPLDPADYHIDACSRAAAAMIERHKDRPFFLYLAYRAPHTPLDPPQRHLERFPGEMPERRRAALAMIAAMDDGVGLVVDTLRRHGLEEKTLIFYMADNGAPLKIHKVDSPLPGDPGGWDGSLNDPLNGEKGMLSEGGVHVPFVVSWPGTIPGGQVYEHPVTALDIAATAVAGAGIEAPPGELDGVDLMPYLTGEKEGPPHEFLAWRWIAQSAIREGDWKLLRGGEREYLYDLGKDLEERHDLSAQHPEIADRLRRKLEDWSAGLEPPGLTNGEMAATWHEYFDHYLENKPVARRAPKTTSDPGAIQGWIARNGSAALRDGALVLEPERGASTAEGKAKGQGPRPFLAHADLGLPGPVTATLTFRARVGGEIGLAWRDREDKDFLPENRATLRFAGGAEAQKHEIELPVASRLIHLRLQPADADGLEILGIQLRGKGGREQSWNFAP